MKNIIYRLIRWKWPELAMTPRAAQKAMNIRQAKIDEANKEARYWRERCQGAELAMRQGVESLREKYAAHDRTSDWGMGK